MECVKSRIIHRPAHVHYFALVYTILSFPTYHTLTLPPPDPTQPYPTLTTLHHPSLPYLTLCYPTVRNHTQAYPILPERYPALLYRTLPCRAMSYPTPYNPTQIFPTTLSKPTLLYLTRRLTPHCTTLSTTALHFPHHTLPHPISPRYNTLAHD